MMLSCLNPGLATPYSLATEAQAFNECVRIWEKKQCPFGDHLAPICAAEAYGVGVDGAPRGTNRVPKHAHLQYKAVIDDWGLVLPEVAAGGGMAPPPAAFLRQWGSAGAADDVGRPWPASSHSLCCGRLAKPAPGRGQAGALVAAQCDGGICSKPFANF